jgi:hypothetical protein
MKRAVSISIGSSRRDKATEISLLGETVSIERIGTDGDMEAAARKYAELDGKVDAFGVGGADLGLLVDDRFYPLYSVHSLVRDVHVTPVVDGNGLKTTLERQSAGILDREIRSYFKTRRVFLTAGVDRWGMAQSFASTGWECLFGDMMFTLGVPMPLYSLRSLKRLAALLMPIVGRIPFSWVYPTGKEQEKRTPKWTQYFDWAEVIAGDCHYITKYMPDRLENKVIVTNTTTEEDREVFRQAGVRYLMTTTPVLEGRSFGTNMMEAALAAACGRTAQVDYAHPGGYFAELEGLLARLDFKPQLQELR